MTSQSFRKPRNVYSMRSYLVNSMLIVGTLSIGMTSYITTFNTPAPVYVSDLPMVEKYRKKLLRGENNHDDLLEENNKFVLEDEGDAGVDDNNAESKKNYDKTDTDEDNDVDADAATDIDVDDITTRGGEKDGAETEGSGDGDVDDNGGDGVVDAGDTKKNDGTDADGDDGIDADAATDIDDDDITAEGGEKDGTETEGSGDGDVDENGGDGGVDAGTTQKNDGTDADGDDGVSNFEDIAAADVDDDDGDKFSQDGEKNGNVKIDADDTDGGDGGVDNNADTERNDETDTSDGGWVQNFEDIVATGDDDGDHDDGVSSFAAIAAADHDDGLSSFAEIAAADADDDDDNTQDGEHGNAVNRLSPVEVFDKYFEGATAGDKIKIGENKDGVTNEVEKDHKIAGLSCNNYGGPEKESELLDIVYWRDIESDSKISSPFHDDEKYLTFEPDFAGWNNVRMGYETIMVLAHAMGRTLVMPPDREFHMLENDIRPGKKNAFAFSDFYHIESLDREHEGLDIISMEDFLKRNLENSAVKPPKNEVDWNNKDLDPLWDHLRTVGHVKKFDPWSCIAVIPSAEGEEAITDLQNIMEEVKKLPDRDFAGNPIDVSAPAVERLQEMRADRDELCVYDREMQGQRLLHFKMDPEEGHRLLIHFYAFIFFQDWKYDLWTKRFVRDHVRYLDKIMCAAGRIVSKLRKMARKKDKKNKDGHFDTMHIRRGDFAEQYKDTQISAKKLFKKSKRELTPGSILFIATDQSDKKWFKPFSDVYDVVYLSDFKDLIADLNVSYYPMLDQIISSKGRVFFGTYLSTFTGYITRLRGYYATKNQLDGYLEGSTKSYYFYPDHEKYHLLEYRNVQQPFWTNEYPAAWRNIDEGINKL